MNSASPRPLVRYNEDLAAAVVDGVRGKRITQKAALELDRQILNAIRIGTAHMLTFGPDEISRLAERFALGEDQLKQILSHAGGRCVNEEELARVWSRIPTGANIDSATQRVVPERIEQEIRMLLHAERDAMRNHGLDTSKIPWDSSGSYYAEAFGIIRGLALAGFGFLGTSIDDNPRNLRAWLHHIEMAVLEEEGFGGSDICDYCFERYGQDAKRPHRPRR